ncbi:hypothetical protein [Paenibacillus oleatilyticus]|uniref:MotA/TolQ/ExbB proton channel domain-containing protein n=1 Tax=Paenibacillus oleatilyticus TaxID=2594886 RepID=A0ABV4V046_9BACL
MDQTSIITISLIICSLFLIMETIILAKLLADLERPLRAYFREWNQARGRAKKRVRNQGFHQTYYAYSRIESHVLKEIRILLKSHDNDSTYFQIAIDLFIRFILPVGTFFLGIIFSTSNNLLSILSKNAFSSDGSKINDLFSMIFEISNFISTFVISLFIISLIQHSFRLHRKKRITQHLLIIDQILEDRED